MKKRIHVNQHNIRYNKFLEDQMNLFPNEPHPEPKPVITVKTYKSNHKANNVHIHGPWKVIYSPDKPLKCGARVWIETDALVDLDCKKIID